MRFVLLVICTMLLLGISFITGFAFCQWGYDEKRRQEQQNRWN